MYKNKIEIYGINNKHLKTYESLSGHDLQRTLFNDVAEREGWNTTVEYIGINGVVPGDDNSRSNEAVRRQKQQSIEESKIIKAFVNNDIGKIAYTVNDEEKFSVAYIDGRLVFENEYLD